MRRRFAGLSARIVTPIAVAFAASAVMLVGKPARLQTPEEEIPLGDTGTDGSFS